MFPCSAIGEWGEFGFEEFLEVKVMGAVPAEGAGSGQAALLVAFFLAPIRKMKYDTSATRNNAVCVLLVLPKAIAIARLTTHKTLTVPIAHHFPIGRRKMANLNSSGGVSPMPHVMNAENASDSPQFSP